MGWFLTSAALLLAAPALAVDVSVSVSSEGYPLGRNEGDELGRWIERAHLWLGQTLELTLPTKVDLDVHVIGSRAAFDAAAGPLAHESGGFVDASGRIVVYGDPNRAQLVGGLLHASSHRLLEQSGVMVPQWIDEGVARTLGNAQSKGSEASLEPRADAESLLRDHARARRLGSLEEVIDWNGSFRPEAAAAQRAYIWGAVYFLLSSREGRNLLRAILNDRSRDEAGRKKTIEDGYRGGAHQLEVDWNEWVADRHEAITLPRASTSEAVGDGWIKCPDGRLIREGTGQDCRQWVRQPDGSLKLE